MIAEQDRAVVGRIAETIKASRRVLVSAHIGPDGDSIGSATALVSALRRLGKAAHYRAADPVPAEFSFFPGYLAMIEPATGTFDLAIVLDTAYRDRVGSAWSDIEPVPTRIVIDHHTSPGGGDIAPLSWIDPSAAAVTMMIACLIDELGLELDRDLAIPLFTGLFTDTSAFRQSNTTPAALRCGARLVESGVDVFEINTRMLENRSVAAVRLTGLACHRVETEDGIAHSYLTRSDFRDLGAEDKDADGIAHALREIGPVRVIALFREIGEGRVKATFRSKDGTNVAKVARSFGGGGHAAAAGCTIEGGLSETREKLLVALRAEMGVEN